MSTTMTSPVRSRVTATSDSAVSHLANGTVKYLTNGKSTTRITLA
jgi:hypothetical protein